MQTFSNGAADRDRLVVGPRTLNGWVPIPLSAWLEVNSDDVPAISDGPLTSDPAGFGGRLATNTTPALQYANGDTDGSLELSWASSNSDPIVAQMPLPRDLDPSNPLELHIVAYMGGATDSPALDLDSYFDVGDTKVSDSDTVDGGVTKTEYVITIAAADIPNYAWTWTGEITPAAHTNDELIVVATWLEYTKLP